MEKILLAIDAIHPSKSASNNRIFSAVGGKNNFIKWGIFLTAYKLVHTGQPKTRV